MFFTIQILTAASLRVDVVDSTAKIPPGESIIFTAWVHNISSAATVFQATRATNDIPDQWSTTLCFGDKCYGPMVDQSDPVAANPGDSVFFDIAFNTDLVQAVGQALMVFDDLVSGEKDSVLFSVSTLVEPAIELASTDTTEQGIAGGGYEVGGFVRNLTDSLLTVTLTRVDNDLPQGWNTSLCFEVCAPPQQDTITAAINPGDSLEFILTFDTDTAAGTGRAKLRFTAQGTADTLYQDYSVTTVATGISDKLTGPGSFTLLPGYPNPFGQAHGRTGSTISYRLPQMSSVEITVFNALGQKIRSVLNRRQRAGMHHLFLKSEDFPCSGTYYYRIKANGQVKVGRLVLLK